MRSSWSPSDKELDEYAAGHLTYEIETLFKQAGLRMQLGTQADPVVNALHEAVLVHLRILDDFLGSPRQVEESQPGDHDDVFARHWLPSWQPRRFLSRDQARALDGHIAHLTARREMGFGWDLQMIVLACADVLHSFFDQLERTYPARFAPLAATRAIVPRIRA